jgi:uncharacterized protein (TIGR03083 family)
MSGFLTTDELVAVLQAESASLSEQAERVLLSDPVPTCPEWTVGQLLQHVGGVQRWATAIVAGALTRFPSAEQEAALFAVPEDNLIGWFLSGAVRLADSLRDIPDDLQAAVFLRNADNARHFWARRQAHETTIHRVDVLSARLGRIPSTGEAGIGTEQAVDGIDELVTGFVPRRSSRLRTDEPFSVVVRATDADAAWTVRVSDRPPAVERGVDPDANSVITGTAAALYLGLWNRGDDIAENGTVDALGHWRQQVRVSWS